MADPEHSLADLLRKEKEKETKTAEFQKLPKAKAECDHISISSIGTGASGSGSQEEDPASQLTRFYVDSSDQRTWPSKSQVARPSGSWAPPFDQVEKLKKKGGVTEKVMVPKFNWDKQLLETEFAFLQIGHDATLTLSQRYDFQGEDAEDKNFVYRGVPDGVVYRSDGADINAYYPKDVYCKSIALVEEESGTKGFAASEVQLKAYLKLAATVFELPMVHGIVVNKEYTIFRVAKANATEVWSDGEYSMENLSEVLGWIEEDKAKYP
jgi:hypothetical protein